jgi:hypothetical protein
MADFLERQEIVPLKDDPPPDAVDHAKVPGFASRFEVLIQDALGQSRQLVLGYTASLDHPGELARALHVGCINAQIVEREAVPSVRRTGWQAYKAPGPSPRRRPRCGDNCGPPWRGGVFHHPLQHLLVSEKECKGQPQLLPASGVTPMSKCLLLRL